MGSMKELAIYGVLLVLGLMAGAYAVPKGQTKILVQHAINTVSTVNVERDWARDYALLNDTQDYQNINFEQLDNKKLLPDGSIIAGSGDTAEYTAPFDTLQKHSMRDPFSGVLGSQGKYVEYTIDSSASNFDSDEFQNWEENVVQGLEAGGGIIQSNTDLTDGKIIVRYQ